MPNRSYTLLTAGIIGAGILLCAFLFGVIVFPGLPWPSPQPYYVENVELNEGAVGSWGYVRTQTYDVALSLNEIQHYYEQEMDNYCVNDWQFKPILNKTQFLSSDSEKFEELSEKSENYYCLKANCKIRRWSLAQQFEVQVCSINNLEKSNTLVVQKDSWED